MILCLIQTKKPIDFRSFQVSEVLHNFIHKIYFKNSLCATILKSCMITKVIKYVLIIVIIKQLNNFI